MRVYGNTQELNFNNKSNKSVNRTSNPSLRSGYAAGYFQRYVKKIDMNSIKPMSSDLLRQRRNLMIFSSILWFLKYAEIEITQFSIFGIEFSSFKNPNSIYIALWVAWIYFAIRYYQYFVQEGFPNLKNVYVLVLDDKSVKKIDIIVKEKFPRNKREGVTYSTLKKWYWVYWGKIDIGSDDMGGSRIESFELKISKWRLLPEMFYSVGYVLLNRSAVTDYLLPILMATFVLTYCFQGWDGSIVKLIKSLIT